MRCRACDAPTTAESGLCKVCAKVSQYHADMPFERAPETVPDGQYFMAMVYKHGYDKSWRDGAGFMLPEDRMRHMWDRALERYQENRRLGMSQYMSFAKATGMANRGNQRFAVAGRRQGGEADRSPVAPEEGYFAGEHQSYDFLW